MQKSRGQKRKPASDHSGRTDDPSDGTTAVRKIRRTDKVSAGAKTEPVGDEPMRVKPRQAEDQALEGVKSEDEPATAVVKTEHDEAAVKTEDGEVEAIKTEDDETQAVKAEDDGETQAVKTEHGKVEAAKAEDDETQAIKAEDDEIQAVKTEHDVKTERQDDQLPAVVELSSDDEVSALDKTPPTHGKETSTKTNKQSRARRPQKLHRTRLDELNHRNADVSLRQPSPPAPTTDVKDLSTPPDLRQIASEGGPDLQDLRGYAGFDAGGPDKESESDDSDESDWDDMMPAEITAARKAIGRNLTRHLIHDLLYRLPPAGAEHDDVENVCRVLEQPRASLENFTDEDFRYFQDMNMVRTEATTMGSAIQIIMGQPMIPFARSLRFAQMDSMTSNLVPAPNPDQYDGVYPRAVHLQVGEDLRRMLSPSYEEGPPIAPNFFIEAKGTGRIDVAEDQARHAGACGARAMHHLRNYRAAEDEITYGPAASSFSAVYHSRSGTLKLFAHHVMRSPDGRPSYFMTLLDAYCMTGTLKVFIKGIVAFRNLRDYSMKKRLEAVGIANAKV